MRRLSQSGVLAVVLAIVTTASCSSESPTTPTLPTVDPDPTVETFSGTLTVNGAVTFPFSVRQASFTTALLRALQPDATIFFADGDGNFIVGETVYQGPSLEEATWSAVAYAWSPATSALSVRTMVGAFAADTAVRGNDSQVERVAPALTTTVVGLALGEWNGTTCSIKLSNDSAAFGSTVVGQVQGAGDLCARVYDVGKLPATGAFTIEVEHR